MVNAFRAANITTFFAYVWIPASLFTLWELRRKDRQETYLALLFGAFILSCGVGHLCHFMAFYWPAYRFFLVVDVFTAAISLATAFALPAAVRKLANLPSHADLLTANESLARMIARQQEIIQARGGEGANE